MIKGIEYDDVEIGKSYWFFIPDSKNREVREFEGRVVGKKTRTIGGNNLCMWIAEVKREEFLSSSEVVMRYETVYGKVRTHAVARYLS